MKHLIPLALLASMSAALAQSPPPEARDGHRGPPQEALAACEGKQAGDKVKASTPHGELSGTCKLVLIPDRRPGPDEGEPRRRERR